jgi:hypothetical protein
MPYCCLQEEKQLQIRLISCGISSLQTDCSANAQQLNRVFFLCPPRPCLRFFGDFVCPML